MRNFRTSGESGLFILLNREKAWKVPRYLWDRCQIFRYLPWTQWTVGPVGVALALALTSCNTSTNPELTDIGMASGLQLNRK